MALLNTVVEERLKEVLAKIETLNENNIIEERNLLEEVVNSIDKILKNKGLPFIEIDEIKNPKDTPVTSEYLNTLQRQAYSAITYYKSLLADIGGRLNTLVDKVASKIDEIDKLTAEQRQEIDNLRTIALNNMNNISILGELMIKHETLKDDNIFTKDVFITPRGAIILPKKLDRELDETVIAGISYRVASPREAENEISYVANVNGKSNDNIIIPGHFQGKLYGMLDRPDDIRLSSDIAQLADGRSDTMWECEYVTNNPISSSYRVVVNIKFRNRLWFNRISIDSDNDINIAYTDEEGKVISITDYDNEVFQLIQTDSIILSADQNHYDKLYYTLLSIIHQGYLMHTYNVLETYNRYIREELQLRYPAIKIEPVKEVEQQAVEEDLQLKILSDKYRYSVAIRNVQFGTSAYKEKGIYETIDIESISDIYGVEVEAMSYLPNADIDWLKYLLSFDGGKNWYRIRPKTESVTKYNKDYGIRIELSDSENTATTQYVDTRSNKVRLRIEMVTNDDYLTPVVFWYKLRIKLKGELNG